MKDWSAFLDNFLKLSNYPILLYKGKISKLEAELKVHQEYEKYRVIQDKNHISDFDEEIKRIQEREGNKK